MTSAAERRDVDSLRIAANNVPPYAYEDSDGWMPAGEMEWHYQLIPVSDMEAILGGLEQGRFDAAIGAAAWTTDALEHQRAPASLFRSVAGCKPRLTPPGYVRGQHE